MEVKGFCATAGNSATQAPSGDPRVLSNVLKDAKQDNLVGQICHASRSRVKEGEAREVKEVKCGQLRAALGTSPRTHPFATFLNHESLPDYRGLYFQPLVSSTDLLLPAGSQHDLHSGLFVSGRYTHNHTCPSLPHCGKRVTPLTSTCTHSRRETLGRGVGHLSQKEREVAGGLTTRTSDTGCSFSLYLGPSDYDMRPWHVG